MADLSQLSSEQIALLKRTIARGASDDELALFVATAERLRLDPFARQIFAVKRWDSREQREIMSIQVSIDGFRVVAERSGDYEGQTAPQWCAADGVWRECWLATAPPVAARIGVWRKGFREALYRVARYDAFVQRTKQGAPNRTWATMPDIMLAKCAEAQALRAAFPCDLSGIYAPDELPEHAESAPALPPPALVPATHVGLADAPILPPPSFGVDRSLDSHRLAGMRIVPSTTPAAEAPSSVASDSPAEPPRETTPRRKRKRDTALEQEAEVLVSLDEAPDLPTLVQVFSTARTLGLAANGAGDRIKSAAREACERLGVPVQDFVRALSAPREPGQDG